MPLPVIANVVRVACQMTAPSGKKATNVFHAAFSGAGAPSSTDIANLDAQLVKLYLGPDGGGGAHVFGQITSGWAYVQNTLTPLDGISPSTVVTHAAAGTLGGTSLPSEVCEVMTIRTAKRGRRYRGRVYLPCVSTLGATSTGFIVGTIQTGFVAQMVDVQALLGGVSWQVGVASYKYGSFELATGFSIDNRFDVQRRRK